MMTSSNRIIFRVTGHLCGEFTGSRWIPRTKTSDPELWCFFFYLRLNKLLSKQSWGWWFETPSHPLWGHRNVNLEGWMRMIYQKLNLVWTDWDSNINFYKTILNSLCSSVKSHSRTTSINVGIIACIVSYNVLRYVVMLILWWFGAVSVLIAIRIRLSYSFIHWYVFDTSLHFIKYFVEHEFIHSYCSWFSTSGYSMYTY